MTLTMSCVSGSVLHDNQFTSISSNYTGEHLRTLDIRNNSITTLPRFLPLLPLLQVLDISNNPIESLAPFDHVCLGKDNIDRNMCFPQLLVFLAKSCSINGTLPYAFGGLYVTPTGSEDQKPLTLFDVSNNHELSGTIPETYIELDTLVSVTVTGTSLVQGKPLHVLEVDPGVFNTYSNGSFQCNALQQQRLTFKADPVFFGYNDCTCSPNFYGNPPQCQSCITGANCTGSRVLSWPVRTYPVCNTETCNASDAQIVALTRCSGRQCVGGQFELGIGAITSGCAVGYTERMCSLCQEGYFPSISKCVECDSSIYAAHIQIAAWVSWVMIQLHLFTWTSYNVYMRLFVFYGMWLGSLTTEFFGSALTQLLGVVLGSLGFEASSSGSHQDGNIDNGGDANSFALWIGYAYRCSFAVLSPDNQATFLAFTMLTPLWVYLMVLSFQYALTLVPGTPHEPFFNYAVRSAIIIFNARAVKMVQACLAGLVYQDQKDLSGHVIQGIPARKYLRAYPWVNVGSSNYTWLAIVASIGLACYASLLLLEMILLMVAELRHKKKRSGHAFQRIAKLFGHFSVGVKPKHLGVEVWLHHTVKLHAANTRHALWCFG
jgi:hypothetical protein